ncbi:MAG: helix-turn-helix domain-containing protein [Gammaproteobacteria bacterium]|nr:helix-turn-helix domain-containing protein [Gammaproteobacteria bacterium]MBU1505476.1 helix-turn-helix domain-containing protein [Gammaproteobacteria bacterium]MBU2123152.1 helix-turn-helix domain-containing protein [Gammaproteobacteria bacterium]MBU2170708.1 helix-turn-helix domain-containing protein [Gammaproteobacteria bacterium]MBU2199942.1 helix-turn-helix domain-containing protein [Gammaproteobacteria bacterium]
MTPATPHPPQLSPKLPQLAAQGFALRHSRQPHYEFDWHVHDCAMLLWPRKGALQSAWQAEGAHSINAGFDQIRLARSQAIILPVSTAHRTQSATQQQEHGELYLAPEIARTCTGRGAIRLDAAALAMLDALLAPALDPRAAEPLVLAVVRQIARARPLDVARPRSPARQMLVRFAQTLEWNEPLPGIEAIACELGTSTRQLQRACQDELGQSPVALRRQMLAAHARRLLATGLSLAQVSVQLGFATSGHLTRLLKSVLH